MVIPAIIPKRFVQIEEDVAKVKNFVSLVQIDICDGVFAPNKTWPFIGDSGEMERLSKEEMGLPFWQDMDYEFHLMIDKPELSLDKWIALSPSSVVFHIEATKEASEIIEHLKAKDIKVGLAIKPSTTNAEVLPFIDKIDFLQVMGSDKIGHHNEAITEEAKEKIKYFKNKFPELIIAIDIGVNKDNAEELYNLGVTNLVSGGAVFDGNIEENISLLKNLN